MTAMGLGCVKTRHFLICAGRCPPNEWVHRCFWERILPASKRRNNVLRNLGPFEFSHSLGRKRQLELSLRKSGKSATRPLPGIWQTSAIERSGRCQRWPFVGPNPSLAILYPTKNSTLNGVVPLTDLALSKMSRAGANLPQSKKWSLVSSSYRQ